MEELDFQQPQRIHLPITIGTEMLVDLPRKKLRLKSELVGMEAGKYLIIKLEHQEACCKADEVRDSAIVVRYLFNGTVYGFRSTVINIVFLPTKLIFATYPEKIEEFKVRSIPRYDCILPATARLGDKTADTVITDISIEGCRCVIKVRQDDGVCNFIDTDREMGIDVKMPGSESSLLLKGRIRNFGKEAEKVTIGFMFEDLEAETKAKLEAFISLIAEIGRK